VKSHTNNAWRSKLVHKSAATVGSVKLTFADTGNDSAAHKNNLHIDDLSVRSFV